MKNSTRISRINDEVMKELSLILRSELKDPRVNAMTSVIRADVTQDLKFCKIYVSVLGGADEKKSVMEGLENANGFIRKLLAERVNLRHTPELIFKLDESVEESIRMNKLLDELSKSESRNSSEQGE